jgi:hypothetical protein
MVNLSPHLLCHLPFPPYLIHGVSFSFPQTLYCVSQVHGCFFT